MTDPAKEFSPYVGLQPYTDEHADYFFGRERDEHVVVANLFAARLTILHGGTGVGKSSLLDAGVLANLRDTERTAAAVFRTWHGDAFVAALKRACVDAVREAGAGRDGLDEGLPLPELLARASQAVRGRFLLVLDQFEEYFVAHPDGDETAFDAELARAVNQPGLDVGLLISLREDALAGLDRFRRRIPNLMANTIKLRHLTHDAAERAIREPLALYNKRFGQAVEIEDELVAAVLKDVRPRASGAPLLLGGEPAADAIEAPFLQLVLERLWQVERGQGSTVLRLETYRRLGDAEGIVGSHFSAILDSLTEEQRDLCARFFDRLVTPSGSKIAYPLDDLDDVAGPLAPEVPATLEALKQARVLREVELPGQKAVEIFHDVLAPKILEWQAEILRRQERSRERRRLGLRILWVVLALLVVGALLGARAYWIEKRAWGTLADLGTGRAYRLDGSQVIVGRNTDQYRNADISIPDRTISRLHLLLYRDRRVIDVRSLNGTTVDASFLQYGVTTRKLGPGDVVVLAGTEAFRFEPIRYHFWQFWTPAVKSRAPIQGWGILVDGRTRAVSVLARRRYFLAVRDGHVVVLEQRADDALVAVAQGENGVAFDVTAGRPPIRYQCAQPNGESYPEGRLPRRWTGDPSPCVLRASGAPFQLLILPA